MSGSGIAPLSTCSHQNVKIGTLYHNPPLMFTGRTFETPRQSPFFWLCRVTTPWWEGWYPVVGPWGSCDVGMRIVGSHSNQDSRVAGMPLLCSRSCCRHSFLSFTFCFIVQSSWSDHKYIIIIDIIGSGWKCGIRFIGVMRRVHSVPCEGLSTFFGASGTLFSFSLFSCSSLSSASAKPIVGLVTGIARVVLLVVLVQFWRGCLHGRNYCCWCWGCQREGLHCGVGSLLIGFMFLRVK